MILDEPTAGLDPEQQIAFRSLIARIRHARLVILSSHVVEDIEQTCHRLAVLDRGRLAYAGTTDGLLGLGRSRDPECSNLEAAYAAIVGRTV